VYTCLRIHSRAVSNVHFPFESHTLDNGLRVILQQDRTTPVVAVHLMYHVGSKNERPGRTGFAHLFEHLLFQGSENVPREGHFKFIQNAGGTLNGTTWFDRTNYFETVPSNELDLALWLESDRMGFFAPSITQAKLDNQRDVVKNERRQSYENRPYGLAFETVIRNAYPPGHPYRHPTIGFMEDLDAATLEDVHDFFRTYYIPNNAALVVCGDFDPSATLARVEHFFGDIPAGDQPPPVDVPVVSGSSGREEITDRVQVPRVYIMFHSPSFNDPDFEAADVLTSLLTEGKSSRMRRELVYERRIAGEVEAFTWPTEGVGMMFAVATARPGVQAPELEAAMMETIDALRAEGAKEEELVGARNRVRRALIRRLQSVGNRADALAHAQVLRGDPSYVNQAFARYDAVTPDDVDAVAHSVLEPGGRTVVTVLPEASDG
jgi:predicted Zn-dependent peptidase